MRKLIIGIAVIVSISFLAGCTKSPYEEGKEFGEKYAEVFKSQDKQKLDALRTEGEKKYKAKYENNEQAQKEFERGFMEGSGLVRPGMEESIKEGMIKKK